MLSLLTLLSLSPTRTFSISPSLSLSPTHTYTHTCTFFLSLSLDPERYWRFEEDYGPTQTKRKTNSKGGTSSRGKGNKKNNYYRPFILLLFYSMIIAWNLIHTYFYFSLRSASFSVLSNASYILNYHFSFIYTVLLCFFPIFLGWSSAVSVTEASSTKSNWNSSAT